jgi:hypothetical protein
MSQAEPAVFKYRTANCPNYTVGQFFQNNLTMTVEANVNWKA